MAGSTVNGIWTEVFDRPVLIEALPIDQQSSGLKPSREAIALSVFNNSWLVSLWLLEHPFFLGLGLCETRLCIVYEFSSCPGGVRTCIGSCVISGYP